MDDHAGRKSTCGREMGNNESSRSGLILLILAEGQQAWKNLTEIALHTCLKYLYYTAHTFLKTSYL